MNDSILTYTPYRYTGGLLSVVMPAYDEGEHIYQNLIKTAETLSHFAERYEILVVNDGSIDNTEEEIRRAAGEHTGIRLITYAPNRGKGGALKEGVRHANGEYIAFFDSDLDLSPIHLQRFLEEIEKEKADIVIGSKMHKDSKVEYPLIRRIFSWGYYLLLCILFHLHTKDTQTGVKLFRRDVILPIMESLETQGYAFDIEILAKAAKQGSRIVEMPVEVVFTRAKEGMGSRIRLRDIWRMFSDTLAIRRRLG